MSSFQLKDYWYDLLAAQWVISVQHTPIQQWSKSYITAVLAIVD